jgi:hypothetical protein
MEYKDMVDPNDSLPNEDIEIVKVRITTDEFMFMKDMLIDLYERKVSDDTFCGIGYKKMIRQCLLSFDGLMEACQIDKDYLYEKNQEK